MKLSKLNIIKSVIIIIMITSLLSLTACNQKSQQSEITLGVLTTLSGDYADFLKGIKFGADYALADFKAIHPDAHIKVIYEDDQSCDKTAAATAAQKLVSINKVHAIVGVTCSSMSLKVGPLAQQHKVLMMSPSSSSKSVSTLGDYVFRTYPSDEARSFAVAQLIQERKYHNVVYVFDQTNDAQVTAVQDVENSLGKEVKSSKYGVSSDDRDFRTVLTKIQQINPEVIVLSMNAPPQVVSFVKQFREFGLTQPLFSVMESAQDEEVVAVLGDTELIYSIFTGPDNEVYQKLANRYKQDTTSEDVPQYLAESYGTMLTLEALYEASGNTEKAKQLLYQLGQNYNGASGTVTFDSNGDVAKPAELMTVRGGEFVKLT